MANGVWLIARAEEDELLIVKGHGGSGVEAYNVWHEIGNLQDEVSDHKLYAISH